jgi:hypothetical protein
VPLCSYLEPTLKIDRDNWVVSIARKKNKEHAMIFIEGIRSFGQRFLQRAHFGVGGTSGIGRIKIPAREGSVSTEFFDLELFDTSKFIKISWLVKRNPSIKHLQNTIVNDVKNPPRYRQLDSKIVRMFSSTSNIQETFNCFTWAKDRIESLKHSSSGEKIVINKSWIDEFFPNTSKVLKQQEKSSGFGCNFM